MSNKNFEIYIDLGCSKIRAAGFNKNQKDEKVLVEHDNISSFKNNELQFLDSENIIEKIIKDLEKKIDEYIDNINLMLDTSNALSISLSLSKNNDGKIIEKKDVLYLVQNAKQQILKSNPDKEIIHIIISKYKVDEKNYDYLPLNIKCRIFSIDIFFICFPKSLIKNIKDLFHKHQIKLNQILCSSYTKSLNYKEQFVNFEKIALIDIGYEKTSVIIYNNENLRSFNILPIGGHHITKDISKVLNFSIEEAEHIKKNLNKNILFSENNNDTEIYKSKFLTKSDNKEVSLGLIKKIIFARIDEILNLSLDTIKFNEDLNEINKFKIILTGQGSKILDNNLIHINETVPLFEEIDFLIEDGISICESGLNLSRGLNKQEVVIIPKRIQRKGFFERLFHFFN